MPHYESYKMKHRYHCKSISLYFSYSLWVPVHCHFNWWLIDWLMIDWLIDWYLCCLIAGSDVRKRMLLKCSITMVYTCPLLSWGKISNTFRENNNAVVFPFDFHIFIPLVNLRFIRLVYLTFTRSSAFREGSWQNLYPGAQSAPWYVSRLQHCRLSPVRWYR